MSFQLTNTQVHVIPHTHPTSDIPGLVELIEANAVIVSPTTPANPTAGKLWYNTTKGVFNIYNGSAWILVGPEIYPITKAAYDALPAADKNDGRFYLITDNDGTIIVDWANVENKPYYISATAPDTPAEGNLWYDSTNDILKVYDGNNWNPVNTFIEYQAGQNIQINPTTHEISATDTTYTASDFDIKDLTDSTGLRTTWSGKQDAINDLNTIRSGAAAGATAVQPLDNVSSLTNDAGYITNAVSDLTNYYTKTQTYTKAEVDNLLSDFGGFEVVEQLPAVATANPHIIYLLGPIGTGGDRYEEWIVTESTLYTNETLDANNPTVNIITPYTLAAADCSATYDHGNVHTIALISGGNSLGAYVGNNKFVIPGPEIVLSPTIEVPAGELSTSGFDSYTSITLPVPSSTTKTWTKIGETSVDLSNYFNTFTDTADSINAGTNNLFVSPSEKSTWNAKQDALTAGDGIDIDANNEISVDVTDIIGTGLSEDANNNIIVDTTVVATQTDLTSKQDKATSGSGAPSTTPTYVGQVYIDTTNDNMYVATGTSSSSDWAAVDTNTTYTAGNGIDISNDEISIDTTVVATKTDLSSKQDTISDLATIRSGASAGATAIQPNDNVSELTNDAGYITSSALDDYSTTTEMNNAISTATSGLATESYVDTALASKQDTLTAGANIQISNNVISATDTTYTAGTGIDITNGVISNTQTSAEWGNITGTLSDQTDLQNALDGKQDTISDLSTIRSNATAGKSASDTIATYGDIVTHDASEFATTAQGALADTAVQPGDNVSDLTNDAGYITNSALNGYATESYVDDGLADKADVEDIPTKTSDLTNDSGFITNAVNDLVNYYTKTQTYSKTEVDNLISSFGNFEVVASLPSVSTANEKTIYLLGPIGTGADKYEEWIVTEDSQQQKQWTKIGETSMDLSNYVTSTQLATTLQDYATTTQLATKQDTLTAGTNIQISNNVISATDTKYTAGTNISIDANNVISATDTTYTAGDGIDITNNEISADTTVLATKTDLNSKQEKLVSGTNIKTVNNNSLLGSGNIDIPSGKNDIIVSTTAPSDTDVIWKYAYNNGSYYDEYRYYNGSDWVNIEGITYSSSAPYFSNNDYGRLWYDESNSVLKYYDHNVVDWMPVGGIINSVGTGLSLSSGELSADTTVLATKTDLSGKQDKATSGSTAPSTTPSYVGQQYIDTTNDKMYVATGTSSSSDWIEVGAGGSGSGDMQYSDFNWVTKTGASITLDLNSYIAPSADFTVNAPATIKDGQIYVLRVATGLVPYTMTLGTNITNPYSESLTLTSNTLSNFSFVATGGNLELQPSVDITGIVTGSYAAAESGTDLSLVTTGEKYIWGNKETKPTSGSGAPSIVPAYVGQRYFRTSNNTWYVANGTTSSSDWTVVDTNTTYTAGTGLTLNGTQFAVDTTTIATKSDIANLGGFEVVDTLPSAATADTKIIYLLGPIGTGADKYEEYIVQDEAIPGHFESASEISHGVINWSYDGGGQDFPIQIDGQYLSNVYLAFNNLEGENFSVVGVGDGSTSELAIHLNEVTLPYAHNTLIEAPIGYATYEEQGSYSVTFDLYASSSPLTWVPASTQKVWTKIGETSIDLSSKQDKATTGTAAPSSTPTYVGQQYVDTTNARLYTAVGTTSSYDWEPLVHLDEIAWKQDKAFSGNYAPDTTPDYEGQQYINLSTNTPYIATGTSSSSDWQAIPILSKQTGAATNIKIWVGTQAAYDALATKDANTLYFTTTTVS